jgi:hypothetical protein
MMIFKRITTCTAACNATQKQENKTSLSNHNWYKVAVEKQPYKLVEVIRGLEKPVARIESERIDATSPAQARLLFIKKNPWLRAYYAEKRQVFGDVFSIEARLDKDLLATRRKQDANYKKRKDEQTQDAWWNKY